jgi:RNA polymerase sigma-70 factor, ECF subfamily
MQLPLPPLETAHSAKGRLRIVPDAPGLDDLARQAQAGDRRALAELCRSIRESILAYMLHALGNVDDAEEATQQVLLSVLEGLPRYRFGDAPVRSWAFTIAHNYAIDYARKRDRALSTDPAQVARAHEDEGARSELGAPRDEHSVLRELISPLSPAHRQVLTLLYEYDLSPEQVGLVLGRTAASVRQEHKRARAKLREIVLRESERVFSGDVRASAGS